MMTTRFASDGRKVSILGFGAMRPPTIEEADAKAQNKKRSPKYGADIELYNEQIKLMLDNGINYYDVSPAYCRGEAEGILGDALVASGYKRSDYIIATKLSNFAPHQYPLEECKKMFENSLKYLHTDYIDNYLLHSIGNGGFETFKKRYIDNGAIDWCLELRKEKRIRNLGFSFHGDKKTFDWCLEHHDKYHWDFCLIQMNYVDWLHADVKGGRNLNAKYLYDRLTELKIPVAIMEPLLGGRLAQYNYAIAKELMPLNPEATLASWALRFCGTFPNVMTILSGMSRTEHMLENIKTCSPLKPCSEEELAALERAAQAMINLRTIPCNSCNYCMPCPYGLDIPAILTFRNSILTSKTLPTTDQILAMYKKFIPEELRQAEHCTGCSRCKTHCPQNIDIAKEMSLIDAWIDELKASRIKRGKFEWRTK